MLKKLFCMALAAVGIFGLYCVTLSGEKEPDEKVILGESISFEETVSANEEPEPVVEPLSDIELLQNNKKM